MGGLDGGFGCPGGGNNGCGGRKLLSGRRQGNLMKKIYPLGQGEKRFFKFFFLKREVNTHTEKRQAN
jgi:hypothetical protein